MWRKLSFDSGARAEAQIFALLLKRLKISIRDDEQTHDVTQEHDIQYIIYRFDFFLPDALQLGHSNPDFSERQTTRQGRISIMCYFRKKYFPDKNKKLLYKQDVNAGSWKHHLRTHPLMEAHSLWMCQCEVLILHTRTLPQEYALLQGEVTSRNFLELLLKSTFLCVTFCLHHRERCEVLRTVLYLSVKLNFSSRMFL